MKDDCQRGAGPQLKEWYYELWEGIQSTCDACYQNETENCLDILIHVVTSDCVVGTL